MLPVSLAEPRQFMRGIAAIAQKHELTLWKPVNQHRHQLPSQVQGRLMTLPFSEVEFLRSIQRGQHRQSPTAAGKGKVHHDRQHDPTMAPAKHHMLMGGPNRVMMTAFTVNMFARCCVVVSSTATRIGLSLGSQGRMAVANTLLNGPGDHAAREKTR